MNSPSLGLKRIENARLLPCVDETTIEDGTVVIDGELIAWVGPSHDLPREFSDEKIPAVRVDGATVMPGLVDGHMHISFGEPHTEEELYIYTPSPYRAIRAAANARDGAAGRGDQRL